jgi:hypothetical protein
MDAGAALQPSAIDVELGQWIYTIPALPASTWMEALLEEDGGAIVPGLMDPDTRSDVWYQFLLGHIDKNELEDGWRSALGAASGQPWWQVSRLVMSCAHSDAWPVVHGKLLKWGVDLDSISLGGLYNVLLLLAYESCKDDSDRTAFEFNLTSPPPEVDIKEAMQEVDVEDDWMAAFRGFQTITGG